MTVLQFVIPIHRYSKPRLYWTFPHESINGVLKRLGQRSSNHRSVSWSLLWMFHERRVLTMVTLPGTDLPVQFSSSAGRKLPSEEVNLILELHGLAPHTIRTATVGGSAIHNYQKVYEGQLAATADGFRIIEHLVMWESPDATENKLRVIFRKLDDFGEEDDVTNLPILRNPDHRELYLASLGDIKHTCSSTQVAGVYLVVAESD